jgi:hypothetical protein
MVLIGASPVHSIEKPRAGRRDVVITPEEYARRHGQAKVIMHESMVTNVEDIEPQDDLPDASVDPTEARWRGNWLTGVSTPLLRFAWR